MTEDQLTGRTRHRITWFRRKCVLQVEECNADARFWWRDATPEDLQRKEINE